MIATTIRRVEPGYLAAFALFIAIAVHAIIATPREHEEIAPTPLDVVIVPPASVESSIWALAAVEARRLAVAEPIVVPATVLVSAPLEAAGALQGSATHYGAELYQGRTMACGGTYETSDATIVAVGADLGLSAPCGTAIRVCGAAGCVDGTRVDTCGGCRGAHVDLSEAGMLAVCGAFGRCDVTVAIER